MAVTSPSPFSQLPTATHSVRTGQNAVERLAVEVVRREIAAMPASLVVQLALWPGEIAAWAREIRSSESLVYNMLAGRKPYTRTRAELARRLDVSIGVVDHLIEAQRATATALRGPAPSDRAVERREPIDWSRAPYPRHRDGTNPIERRAVRVMEVDVASMPAATVVGLAMWPESLSAWSRAERLKSSVVWATLAGSPSVPVRDALARRLDVTLRTLDALVTDAKATSVAFRASPPPPPSPTADTPAPVPPVADRPRPRSDDDEEQLGFAF
jgi:hypothetical protein